MPDHSFRIGMLLLLAAACPWPLVAADDGDLRVTITKHHPTSMDDVFRKKLQGVSWQIDYIVTEALKGGPVLVSSFQVTVENLDTGYRVEHQFIELKRGQPAFVVGWDLFETFECEQYQIARYDQGRYRVTYDVWAKWDHLDMPPVRARKRSEFTIVPDELDELVFYNELDTLHRQDREEPFPRQPSTRTYKFCMDDQRLEMLSCAAPIHALLLQNAPVTDRGIHAILGPQNPLRTVDLRGTRVTGASLRRLAPHPTLEYLQLDGVPITPEDLAAFEESPAIQELRVDSPHLEGAHLERLQQSQPLMDLYYRGELLPPWVE